MNEKNQYSIDTWKQELLSNPFYKTIIEKYDGIVFSYFEMTFLRSSLHNTVYDPGANFLKDYNILDAVSLYYIRFLLEKSPNNIIDIGCGVNRFKKIIPNVIGLDADRNSNYDVFDHFDKDYSSNHLECFDAVICINTIHFASITTITERLLWIADILTTGGRAFVTFNFETWLMYSSSQDIKDLFGLYPKFTQVVDYMSNQITNTGLKFIVEDWPILDHNINSTVRDDLNGNVRLVFEKQ